MLCLNLVPYRVSWQHFQMISDINQSNGEKLNWSTHLSGWAARWYGYMLNWHKSNIKYMAMNEREFKINVILSPPLLRQLTRRVWAIVSISLWPPLSFMLSHMLPDAMLYCENCEKQYREHPCGRNLALKWMKRLCESPDGKKPASQPPPTKKHLVPSLRHPDVTSIFPLFGVGPSSKS